MAGQRRGEGIDVFGGPVIDPTKNVLDLVRAESVRQDGLRDAESKYQNAMREAEARRMAELSEAHKESQNMADEMRQKNLDAATELLAAQLRDVKRDFDDRMSKMEQFRWETGGKTGGQAQIISWVVTAAAVTFAVIVFILKG